MQPHDEILQLFAAWDAALRSGDPDAVVACYADDAVLLPTFSNQVRRSPAEIRSYFAKLVDRGPSAAVIDGTVRAYGDVAIHSGTYEFGFATGPLRVARARFTFVYRRTGSGWRIVEHHSSAMPEQAVLPRPAAAQPNSMTKL